MSKTLRYAIRRRPLAVMMAGLLVTAASEAVVYAAPLPWTAAWDVMFGRTLGNSAQTLGSFGANAGMVHGQIEPGSDLLNQFHARAQAFADAGLLDSDIANVTVTFERPFTLLPGGPYNLFLSARNVGGLLVSDTTTDVASVTAKVCANPVGAGGAPGAAIVCVDVADHPFFGPITAPPAASRIYDTGRIGDVALAIGPGNYVIQGFLFVSASSILSDAGIADAAARFHTLSPAGFDGEASFTVIPEPSTVLLLASGLTGYAVRRRRRAV